MDKVKVYCYDSVCKCWVEDFQIHKIGDRDLISINQVWSTKDVNLYVSKQDYDLVKQENTQLKEEVLRYKQLSDSTYLLTKASAELTRLKPDILFEKSDEEYSKLKQENAQLKTELRKWQNLNIENLSTAYINGLEHTLKHYQEALRKCSPYSSNGTGCYSCGAFFSDSHADDCEYIQLTKESEGEG